jgi:hypothetical protein
MNAPEIKQIIRVVIAKKLLPTSVTICGISEVAFNRSTMTAQMLKPMMDAPTNRYSAL